jgi:hypothetical protein
LTPNQQAKPKKKRTPINCNFTWQVGYVSRKEMGGTLWAFLLLAWLYWYNWQLREASLAALLLVVSQDRKGSWSLGKICSTILKIENHPLSLGCIVLSLFVSGKWISLVVLERGSLKRSAGVGIRRSHPLSVCWALT